MPASIGRAALSSVFGSTQKQQALHNGQISNSNQAGFRMSKKYLSALGLLALFSLLIAGIFYSRPFPRAGASNAAPQEFSSARALRHLTHIASVPHPVGSSAHAQVENYIREQTQALGVVPEVEQSPVLVSHGPEKYTLAYVRNVVARIPGTNPTRPVIIAAHYDSAGVSPGAADDGAAVAAMLEIFRMLRTGPALRNDIIFFYSDGEENGLYGARAFLEHSEIGKQAGVVLNFDARGSTGPSIMYETSDNNGWLVQTFAHAAPAPYATSLTSSLYRLLPNSTDFTVFRKAGIPGLNFAFAENWNNYHSQMDTIEHLDPRSLQHHGTNALALVREFGMMDLSHVASADGIYFNLFSRTLVFYKSNRAVVFGVVVTLMLLAGVLTRGRRKSLRLRAVTLGALYPICCVIASGAICWLLTGAIRKFSLPYRMRADIQHADDYLLAFAIIGITCSLALYALFRRNSGWISMLTGISLMWLLLMWVSIFYARGSSYLFTWPLLVAAVVLCTPLLNNDMLANRYAPLAAIIAALPALLLLVPAIQLMFIAFTLPGAFLAAAFTALCAAFFVPQMELMAKTSLRVVLGVPAVAVLGFLLTGTILASRDAKFTRADHISYIENGDKKTAAWSTMGAAPDAWTAQFFPARGHSSSIGDYLPQWFAPKASQPLMAAQAPLIPLESPQVGLLQDVKEGDQEKISLRFRSPGRAPQIYVCITSEGGLRGASVEGLPLRGLGFGNPGSGELPASRGQNNGKVLFLSFFSLPDKGADLTFRVPALRGLTVSLVEKYFDIPAALAGSITPRPSTIMKSRNDADETLLVKTYAF